MASSARDFLLFCEKSGPGAEQHIEREEETNVGRKKEPISLLEAKGKSHLTKAEKDERGRSEVKPTGFKQVRPPDWLPTNLRKEFNAYSRQLVALGIFTPLDRDTLARYMVAHEVYLKALNYVQEAISSGESGDAVKWSTVQNRYFAQCRECASDLGLTISSRCKLVVPQKEDPAEGDPFLTILEGKRRA